MRGAGLPPPFLHSGCRVKSPAAGKPPKTGTTPAGRCRGTAKSGNGGPAAGDAWWNAWGILLSPLRKKRGETSSSLLIQQNLLRDDGLHDLDLPAVVSTALLAHSVGQVHRTAFRAHDQIGGRQLPVGAAPLIPSRFGYFTLGYCHCDTSLILQKARSALLVICSPKALPGPPAGGPAPFCRSRGRDLNRRRTGGTIPCNLPNTVFCCPFRG